MGPLDLLLHVSGFLAPAFFVALLMPLAAGMAWRGRPAPRWAWQALAVFATGAVVLLLGLWGFGRDGKMATYGALVLSAATALWLLLRGWR